MPIGDIRDRVDEITTDEPDDSGKPPEQHGPQVRAAGRIIRRRPSGGVIWIDVRDWTGTIQVMVGKKQVGPDNFALAKCTDLGDIIGSLGRGGFGGGGRSSGGGGGFRTGGGF